MKQTWKMRPLVALLLALSCILGFAMPALAVPPQPYSPWGTVTISGAPAPDGTEVTAWIGGVRYAATYTLGGGWYSIDVPGDDPDTPGKDGGLPGETVVFRVNGVIATPTGTWTSGAAPRLDLVATSPTAVTLLSFSAAVEGSVAMVRWQTASEMNNVGFNLYRSSGNGSGQKVRLNAGLIPSQAPGSSSGATYVFRDEGIEPGAVYAYWLEDVDNNGTRTLHGPAILQQANSTPEALRINPANGQVRVGNWQTFKATYRDGDGAEDLQQVFIGIADGLNNLGAGVQLRYDATTGMLYLWNGSDWSEGKALPSGNMLANDLVVVRLKQSQVKTLSGDTLQLVCSLKFKPSFKGVHNIYLRALDSSGADSHWVESGQVKVK